MKKKISLVLLCGVILFGLTGCGSSNDDDTYIEEQPKQEEKETLTGVYKAGDFTIMLLDNSECNMIFGYIEGYDDISVSTNNCKWYSIDTNANTKVYISYTVTSTTMYGQTYNQQVNDEWIYSNGALSNSEGGHYEKVQ